MAIHPMATRIQCFRGTLTCTTSQGEIPFSKAENRVLATAGPYHVIFGKTQDWIGEPQGWLFHPWAFHTHNDCGLVVSEDAALWRVREKPCAFPPHANLATNTGSLALYICFSWPATSTLCIMYLGRTWSMITLS